MHFLYKGDAAGQRNNFCNDRCKDIAFLLQQMQKTVQARKKEEKMGFEGQKVNKIR